MVDFDQVKVKYGNDVALDVISFQVPKNSILGVIGPANSGKTTMLKCINRTIDFIDSAKVEGTVKVNGEDVRKVRSVYQLRRNVGMVFPLPVGLPMSIYENVAYAPRRKGIHDRDELDELVVRCLKQSMLWDEVKDRLDSLGTKLSGGQQQRVAICDDRARPVLGLPAGLRSTRTTSRCSATPPGPSPISAAASRSPG